MAQKIGMKREDFMAVVGFYGNTALVDKKLLQRLKNARIESLIENGFLFQAVSVALFNGLSDNSDEAQKTLCDYFHVDNFNILLQRFGVHEDLLRNFESYQVKYI